jgi:hypothetical protein
MNLRPTVAGVAFAAGLAAQAAAAPQIEATVAAALQRIDRQQIEATVRTLAGFQTRHVLSATDGDSGTGAARAWLLAQYEAIAAGSGGRLSVALQTATVPCARPNMPKEVKVVNVVATLRGTADPDRIYVVGGHYDSRNGKGEDGVRPAPGANDDASGTAVALAACRAMAATPWPATLVFVAYDGEEQGLLGSQAQAAAFASAGAKVDGMIGCDIVGNTLGMDGARYDGVMRCFGYAPTGNDSSGRSLQRAVTFAARRHVADFGVKLVLRGDRFGRGGDHRSFFEQGFPAVRCSELREDFSRQHADVVERDGKPYGDVPDYVDFGYVANVARVVVAALGELASAPPPPLAQRAELRRDRYDTQLEFTLPDGADDCEFVWRDTTAADWQGVVSKAEAKVAAGPRGLVAVLAGICLDDTVVGVRCIGKDGSRSRVATPPEPDRFQQRPLPSARTEGPGK